MKPETSKIRVKSGLLEALPRLQSLNFHIVGLRVSKGRAPPPSASASCGVSIQFNPSVVSDSLRPHGLHHAKLPCPSPTPGVYSNSCPSMMMPFNHLILCRPLLPPSVLPSIGVFSNESVLRIRWLKYWEFQLQHQSFQ